MNSGLTISKRLTPPVAMRRSCVAASAPLGRALSRLSEDIPNAVARRVSTAFETILSWTLESQWEEVVWSFSNLTVDGFPVEFTFSSVTDDVCYAAEVAAPEVSAEERLPRALTLVEYLGKLAAPAEIVRLLKKVQAPGDLTYGAWIGGRHGVGGDHYKVYVEVPGSARQTTQSLFSDFLGTEPILNNQATQLRIIGYDPLKHRLEVYFQVGQMETWELARLLGRVGLSCRVDELLSLLTDIYGCSMGETVPTENLGFSYSFSLNGAAPTFSLFIIPRSVFGSDQSIRRALLSLGARRGWNFTSYAKVSAPVASRTAKLTRHSLLSLVVPLRDPISVRIGMSPPIGPDDRD
jgi:hypothetical protein